MGSCDKPAANFYMLDVTAPSSQPKTSSQSRSGLSVLVAHSGERLVHQLDPVMHEAAGGALTKPVLPDTCRVKDGTPELEGSDGRASAPTERARRAPP